MINNQVNDTFALFSNKQLIGGCLEFLQEGLKIALCEVVKAALNSGQTMSQFSLTTVDIPLHVLFIHDFRHVFSLINGI